MPAYAPPPEPAPVPDYAEPEAPPPAAPQAAEMDIIPLAEMEKALILAALERTGNDVPRAAAMLQVNPSTIYRKLQAWRPAAQQ